MESNVRFNPLYNVGLSLDNVARICNIISRYEQIEEVLIYGSRAMGTFKPASDIDLTLIGNEIDLTLLFKLESDLDDLMLPYKFDISIYGKITNPAFRDDINRVGFELYKR